MKLIFKIGICLSLLGIIIIGIYNQYASKTVPFSRTDSNSGANIKNQSLISKGNGFVKVPSNVTDSLAASISDTLNLREFGAKGNGIVNDGEVIQKAINTLKSGQVLYIPNGKYLITQTLIPKSNISIVGQSARAILQYKWGKFSQIHKLIYGFLFTDQKNIMFKNFSIDGGAKNYKQIIIDGRGNQTWDVDGTYNLFFFKPNKDYAVDNIKFVNLNISNSFFDAIHCYARPADPDPKYFTSNIYVNNCHFSSIGCHGVGFGKIKNATVENCSFKNIGLMAMTNSGYGSGLGVDASGGTENILIQNNTVDGAGGGFKTETHENNGGQRLTSTNIRILNNTIKNLYQGPKYRIFYGIKVNGAGCIVKGNNISSFASGILIGKDAVSCTVTDNKIIQTLNSDAAGIRCDMNGGNITISNNSIKDAKAQGILVAGNGVTLSNNLIRNSGSDNIRIALGDNIKIENNICYNGGSNGICVVPLSGKKIGKIDLSGNICYDTRDNANRTQKNGILIANANNITKSNNTLYNNIVSTLPKGNQLSVRSAITNTSSSGGFHFTVNKPSSGIWKKGDIAILKSPIAQTSNGKKKLLYGWRCVIAGSPGKWNEIIMNN